MTTDQLPHLNASLNLVATMLLVTGYWLIRGKRETAHKWTMIACFAVSCAFLTSYLIYHASELSKPFPRQDYAAMFSILYYLILVTHVVLAATVPFLAISTIVLGLLDRRQLHRRLARWTFPIWLYVSITGVMVYLMLYWIFLPGDV